MRGYEFAKSRMNGHISISVFKHLGQTYYGPVVLIIDALCYKPTVIFAAGFQDHEIGPILGTSGNTGDGGANVWPETLLEQLIRLRTADTDLQSNPCQMEMVCMFR
jgi:hypothetical protein